MGVVLIRHNFMENVKIELCYENKYIKREPPPLRSGSQIVHGILAGLLHLPILIRPNEGAVVSGNTKVFYGEGSP